jgi:nitroreductase
VSCRTVEDPVRAIEDYAAASAATQNVLLAAHALGLGAIWRTGDMAFHPAIVEHLGLAPSDRIVAFVYIGRPAMATPSAQARDIDTYIRVID